MSHFSQSHYSNRSNLWHTPLMNSVFFVHRQRTTEDSPLSWSSFIVQNCIPMRVRVPLWWAENTQHTLARKKSTSWVHCSGPVVFRKNKIRCRVATFLRVSVFSRGCRFFSLGSSGFLWGGQMFSFVQCLLSNKTVSWKTLKCFRDMPLNVSAKVSFFAKTTAVVLYLTNMSFKCSFEDSEPLKNLLKIIQETSTRTFAHATVVSLKTFEKWVLSKPF